MSKVARYYDSVMYSGDFLQVLTDHSHVVSQ